MNRPERLQPGVKLRDADKVSRIPIKIVPSERETMLRKPDWLRVKLPASNQRILDIKSALRKNGLHSVCEEASCPNLAECFNHGTATFMILGAICTRRCPFCDVSHGKPNPLDIEEPRQLAEAVAGIAAGMMQAAGEAVRLITRAGVLPAGLEIMDHTCIKAVNEAFGEEEYPPEAGAVLLIELDGQEPEVKQAVTVFAFNSNKYSSIVSCRFFQILKPRNIIIAHPHFPRQTM